MLWCRTLGEGGDAGTASIIPPTGVALHPSDAAAAISNWAKAASKLAPQDVPQGGGHVRVLSGETLWCSRCGGHASNFAKSLRYPCTGSPFLTWNGGSVVKRKVGRSVNLKFLRAGIHPVTHSRMQPPITEPSWAGVENTTVPLITMPPTTGTNTATPTALLQRIRTKEVNAK